MKCHLTLVVCAFFFATGALQAAEPPGVVPSGHWPSNDIEMRSVYVPGVPPRAAPAGNLVAPGFPAPRASRPDRRTVRPDFPPHLAPKYPSGSIRDLVAARQARTIHPRVRGTIEDVLHLEVEYWPHERILVDDLLFFRLKFTNVSAQDIHVTNLPLPSVAPLVGAIESTDPADFLSMIPPEWMGGYSTPTRPTYFRPGESFTIYSPRLSIPIDTVTRGTLYFRSTLTPIVDDANGADLFSERQTLNSETYELEIIDRPDKEKEVLKPWGRLDEVRGCELDQSGWPTRLQPEEFMALVPYGCDTLEELRRLEAGLSEGTCRDTISLYRRVRTIDEVPARAATETAELVAWLKSLPDVERQVFLHLIPYRCLTYSRVNSEKDGQRWKGLGATLSQEFPTFGKNPITSQSHRKPLPAPVPPQTTPMPRAEY